ncbi:AGL071C-Ap [Eremothecium gossypii ATCC 10895]|uniref:N-alpha-acetyltransferase 40 n=1 Tax=Eremothecium gossypii (strain ATCC 10895 / CBS 109.51 / FGSC 9923 / NRRL Y-1056) TaxID=284811 RepID=D8FGG3_EREGS|nr:AGL071C-Ap [Eremothecium gossypii ATCC 10895]ADJ41740.1 AGL071C-Ap [Eremothecium gossypii ATCC 10895]AEY98751.1 FAGL071C-Ap [Eremothecium gossypii FDAG1]
MHAHAAAHAAALAAFPPTLHGLARAPAAPARLPAAARRRLAADLTALVAAGLAPLYRAHARLLYPRLRDPAAWPRCKRAELLDPAALHILYRDPAGRLACFISLLLPGPADPVLYILELHVAAPFRRRGLAAALLDAATRTARAAGLTRLELTVFTANRPALALYARAGFRPRRALHPDLTIMVCRL